MTDINYAEKLKELENLNEYSALTEFFRTHGLHAAAKLLRAWEDAGRPQIGQGWDRHSHLHQEEVYMANAAARHLSHSSSPRRRIYEKALLAYTLRETNALPPDFKLGLPKKAPRLPTLDRVKALRDKRTGHPKEKQPTKPDLTWEQRKERRKLEVTFGHLYAVWYQVSTLPRSEDVQVHYGKVSPLLMFFRPSGEMLWHITATREDGKVVFKLQKGNAAATHLKNLEAAEEALIEFLDTILE